ncbi:MULTISPECIES: IS3 family transposase [Pirellulaceae]|uniref:Integrase core domain protein n=1 Tax=Mariniblastus fucicola TaxID=980251 RepID=A0A5B9P734_9BACT|nr:MULTISPECIES: IS3 family transposase [Pirellulaceae]QEG20305.1 Integrase core domain protein [Mariniblastus fucicola]QEG22245.1 Integrase core domain protein [Mariniblastus fucicola]QEG22286.1 Integrase core domain protein [Mariniblastus fucicola]QEG22427.1 Integrase core domain protein [Mariniblastus fucicola]QEG22931.1 Integrase core domain protein [Mariniblastus fucicola]
MKYAWIKQHRDQYSITLMCEIFGVSKSGYYDSIDRPESKRAVRSRAIRESVKQVYEESGQIYGSYKIAEELANDAQLETACRNTVATAMREMGLKSCVSRQFKPTTTKSDPDKKPAENLLSQEFDAEAPNRKWVADITYLPTVGGWVYLAVVLDLFSRKVVGWQMSDRLTTPIVTEALRKAIESRRPESGTLLHHSDRGCQYTSDAFQGILRTLNIQCSMSRTGCCYDNAVMERFFWSLKHEWTKHRRYGNLEEARISVFKYIEAFYNSKRIHQTLGYQTPEEFERNYRAALAA